MAANDDSDPLIHFVRFNFSRGTVVPTKPGSDYLDLQIQTIEPFFDRDYYSHSYKIDPEQNLVRHYLVEGWLRGFEPNARFSTDEHLERFGHILKQNINPFFHYISTYGMMHDGKHPPSLLGLDSHLGDPRISRIGVRRIVESEFDRNYYLAQNPDVHESEVDPLEHFLEYGWKEGRNPSEIFWTNHYAQSYGSIIAEETNPYFHYLARGRERGLKPNPFSDRLWPALTAPSSKDWNTVKPANNLDSAEVVVIIPVYKGYDETLRVIYEVLTGEQASRFALLVINDRTPDERLQNALIDLSHRQLFVYQENKTNIGFVASANYGLALCAGKHVILLNSDARPFSNWIDRMLYHSKINPDVATITPLSNNATICSYPHVNVNNRLQLEVPLAQLDQYASECNRRMSSEIPTGVGFCMFISADALAAIGLFDVEQFGKGYGEENDFCMRASKAGFYNLLAHDIFVYHAGGISFSTAYTDNSTFIQDRVLQKHPDYLSEIRNYIAADPSREARMRLDLFRLAKHVGTRSAVFLVHDRGGGTATHVRDAAARLCDDDVEVIFLRIASNNSLELVYPASARRALPLPSAGKLSIIRHADLIAEFLNWLRPLFVHVHSLVDLDWESTNILMNIISNNGRYFVTLHDYASVCHRNNLVTTLTRYCGLAPVERCRQCIAGDHSETSIVDPQGRREQYAKFLEGAKAVFAPSNDLAERISAHQPGFNILVRPHEERLTRRPPASPRADRPRLKIAALGAIGPHKGSAIIYNLATDRRLRNLPVDYTIIGYSNLTAELRSVDVHETGPYRTDNEAIDLLHKAQADLVLIPSIWPETYCYTLSIALASGIPPVVFDIGAQAERLRRSGEGLIIPYNLISDTAKINDILLGCSLDEIYKRRRDYEGFTYQSSLRDYYSIADEQCSAADTTTIERQTSDR
jgi:GT2 family glycosyltransferase/glycosyltransferase involved in cell wall biosynthesis